MWFASFVVKTDVDAARTGSCGPATCQWKSPARTLLAISPPCRIDPAIPVRRLARCSSLNPLWQSMSWWSSATTSPLLRVAIPGQRESFMPSGPVRYALVEGRGPGGHRVGIGYTEV